MKSLFTVFLVVLQYSLISTQLVAEVTSDNFDNVTTRTEGSTLIMFYTPWCPHCQDTKPIFLKAALKMAEKNQSNRFALINCDNEKNSNLCTSQKVEGYPTIKLYSPGNESYVFMSETTEDNFIKFFDNPSQMFAESTPNEENVPVIVLEHTPYLNTDNFKSTLSKTPHALVFFYAPWCQHCQEAKPKLDGAAKKLDSKERFIFAVNCEDAKSKDLCETEKVDGFPTIKYYRLGEMFAEYDNAIESDSFLEYLSNPPKDKVPQQQTEQQGDGDHEDPIIDENKMANVEYVDMEQFNVLLKNHDGHLMNMFYVPSCSHCMDAKPIFDAAAKELRTSASKTIFSALNCEHKANEKLCEQEHITGFPTINHYFKGKLVKEYTDRPLTKEKLLLYFSSKAKEEL